MIAVDAGRHAIPVETQVELDEFAPAHQPPYRARHRADAQPAGRHRARYGVGGELDILIASWREFLAEGMDPDEVFAGFVVASAHERDAQELAAMLGVAVRRLAVDGGEPR